MHSFQVAYFQTHDYNTLANKGDVELMSAFQLLRTKVSKRIQIQCSTSMSTDGDYCLYQWFHFIMIQHRINNKKDPYDYHILQQLPVAQ